MSRTGKRWALALLLAMVTILLATVSLTFIVHGMLFYGVVAMMVYALWVPLWAFPLSWWVYRRRSSHSTLTAQAVPEMRSLLREMIENPAAQLVLIHRAQALFDRIDGAKT